MDILRCDIGVQQGSDTRAPGQGEGSKRALMPTHVRQHHIVLAKVDVMQPFGILG
ncbi:hypothetical protein D3C71_2012160 [compost metagenome]